MFEPQRLLNAALIVAIMAVPFHQAYGIYRKYKEDSDHSGMFVGAVVAMALIFILTAAAVVWNVLGSFGVVPI